MKSSLQSNDKENNMDSQVKIQKDLESVIKRQYRSFNIYCGPVLVGLLEEIPGTIIGTQNKLLGKHRFLKYFHYDMYTETTIIKQIQFAETFDHLLTRLLKIGFDLAASQDAETRKLVGRCWHILYDKKEKIGALWDYPGQISTLTFHPRVGDLQNDHFTLSLYDENNKQEVFNVAYRIFNEAKNIQQIREMLEKQGWKLRTTLYKFI